MKPMIIHAAFNVKDLDKSIEFYKKLGFNYAYDLKHEDGSIWLAYLNNEHHQFIELFPNRTGDELAKNESFFHVCYKVEGIEEFAKKLQDEGVQLWSGPRRINKPASVPFVASKAKCNSYAFFIQDPDGNDIEIMEYSEDSLQLPY